MMPTTCHGWPLSVMFSPTTYSRPPKRVCHSSWLMMQTAGPFGHVFVRGEVAAARRQDAERRQERRADALAVQLLRLAVAGQREVVERRDADRRERLRVRRECPRSAATTARAR